MQPLDLLGIISRLAMLVDLVWGLKQAPRLNKMTMTKGVLALTFHRWQCLMSFAEASQLRSYQHMYISCL